MVYVKTSYSERVDVLGAFWQGLLITILSIIFYYRLF